MARMVRVPTVKLRNGMAMPVIGLGTWQLASRACAESVKLALSLGYSHIDTAEAYQNEAEIGEAIAASAPEGLFIASKVFHNHLSRDDVLAAATKSRARLGIKTISLYYVHWPNKRVPMSETFAALGELVESGMIEGVGVSNFTIRHLEEALRASPTPILANQVEFHPFLYQRELLAYCKERGVQLVAYSPLARGRVFRDGTIKAVAERHGKSPGQVALRWLLDKGVVVIPKASSEEHLRENLDVFDFSLSPEETRALDNLPQERLINPPFAEF